MKSIAISSLVLISWSYMCLCELVY